MSLNGQFDHEEAAYEAWLDELNRQAVERGLDAVTEFQKAREEGDHEQDD